MKIVILFLSLVGLLVLLYLVGSSLNKMEKFDDIFCSTFECGYSSSIQIRSSFSVHYFLVSILFLFLDLELCILFPLFCLDFSDLKIMSFFFVFVYVVLNVLFLEWGLGTLDWSN